MTTIQQFNNPIMSLVKKTAWATTQEKVEQAIRDGITNPDKFRKLNYFDNLIKNIISGFSIINQGQIAINKSSKLIKGEYPLAIKPENYIAGWITDFAGVSDLFKGLVGPCGNTKAEIEKLFQEAKLKNVVPECANKLKLFANRTLHVGADHGISGALAVVGGLVLSAIGGILCPSFNFLGVGIIKGGAIIGSIGGIETLSSGVMKIGQKFFKKTH